jgi:hypothetical protein
MIILKWAALFAVLLVYICIDIVVFVSAGLSLGGDPGGVVGYFLAVTIGAAGGAWLFMTGADWIDL